MNDEATGLNEPAVAFMALGAGALGVNEADCVLGVNDGAATFGAFGYQEAATFIFGTNAGTFDFIWALNKISCQQNTEILKV